jgi:hypothetical protein
MNCYHDITILHKLANACHTWMNLDDNWVISIGYFNLKTQYHMGRLFTNFQKFNNQLIDYE